MHLDTYAKSQGPIRRIHELKLAYERGRESLRWRARKRVCGGDLIIIRVTSQTEWHGLFSQVHAVLTVYDAISLANTIPSDPRVRACGSSRDSRSFAFPPNLSHAPASPNPPISCPPPLRWAPPSIPTPTGPAAKRLGTTRSPPPPVTPPSLVGRPLPKDQSRRRPSDAALFVV